MRILALFFALFALPAAAQETAFDVHIHFDAAAAAALRKSGEMVMVSAVFSGEPAAGNTLALDEMGMVYLGAEQLTLWPKDQMVHLGRNLDGAPIGNVTAPLVNVNVYSARFTDENNLLDCGIVDGPTADFVKAPQEISCALIGG